MPRGIRLGASLRTKFYHHEYRIFKQLGRGFINSRCLSRNYGPYLDRPVFNQSKTGSAMVMDFGRDPDYEPDDFDNYNFD